MKTLQYSLLLLIAACNPIVSSTPVEIDVHTNLLEYQAGEAGILHVVNAGRDTLFYDCLFLERRADSEWQQLGNYGRCLAIAYPTIPIPPNDSVVLHFTIDGMFDESGEYRFVLPVAPRSDLSSRVGAFSNTFRVVPGGAADARLRNRGDR